MTTPTTQSRVTATVINESPSVVDLFNTLWFRRRLLFSTALFIIVVGGIALYQLVPRYTTSSSVLIGIPKTNTVDIEEVLKSGVAGRTAIASEIEVLRSRELARKVIEKFNLVSKEEFNPGLRSRGLLSHLKSSQWVKEWWESLGFESAGELSEDESEPGVELSEDEKDQKYQLEIVSATNILLSKLKISQIGQSHVVKINFESTDPTLAAAIANKIPDVYIIGQLEAQLEATKKATDWLDEQLSKMKVDVEISENAVESFREQHNLTEAEGFSILNSRLAEVNRQLIAARTERVQAEVRLQHIKKMQKKGGSGIESLEVVMSSGVIQQLRALEATLTTKASELSVEHGPKHKKIRQVDAEISNIRERIDLETKRIVIGQEHEVEVAQSKEQSLDNNLMELTRQTVEQEKTSVRLHTLEREASANRLLFETFLSRYKETSSRTGIAEAEARVISKAEIPRAASFPNTKKILIMIFAGAFIAAGILVNLVQAFKQGLLSPEEIENELGLAAIGMIPTIPGNNKAQDYILEKPHSNFAEALNTLKTTLILSSPDEVVKVLQITSSVPKEGKSTLALAFTRFLAKTGNKVILVDGDLRLGSLEKKLGVSAKSKGLTDLVMSNVVTFDEFVFKDEKSGAFIMPNGGAEFVNATDVFSSHRMQVIIDFLKKNFDYVIIDAPPVMAVSDARVIGKLVDKTVFVVRWNKTPRKIIKAAVNLLIDSGVAIIGCVMLQVDMKRSGTYDQGDYSGYYSD